LIARRGEAEYIWRGASEAGLQFGISRGKGRAGGELFERRTGVELAVIAGN
jgi:hypothetical protein